MSRKYVATLAMVAFLILAIGSYVRARLMHAEAPKPAPPSEASALQQLSQEGQLRHLSSYLSERVTAVASAVEYVPSTSASGVRWGAHDSLLTTLPGRPIVVVLSSSSDSTHARIALAPVESDSVHREWTVIVARSADGGVISSVGALGGRSFTQCGRHRVTEYILGAAVGDAFAGGGLFDLLSGVALGIVVRCGDRNAAISISDAVRLLMDSGSAVDRLMDRYGLGLDTLDESTRSYFRTDSGVVVTELRRGGAAANAGLRVGDVLLSVGGERAHAVGDVAKRLVAASDSQVVARLRGRSVATIHLAPNSSQIASEGSDNIGINLAERAIPRGVAIGSVRNNSRARTAGLRAGDRLLRIGDTPVISADVARHLLDAASGRLTFIVYERDSVERGTLLRTPPASTR